MLTSILLENGFSEKEAVIYISALEMGEATVAQLSTRAHLKRTTVYSLLDQMKTRGLISFSKRRNIVYVSPLPPRVLVDRFKRASRLAEEALPDLVALAYASPLKPRMRILEGIEGIKNVLLEFGDSVEPTMGFTDYNGMPREIFDFIRTEVVPRRKARDITARFLVPMNAFNKKVQAYDASRKSEHRFFDFGGESGLLELLLFGKSTVAFLSLEKHEMFAIVIDSVPAHRMLKGIFHAMWRTIDR